MSQSAKPKTRPVHEIKFGRIRAAVWENQTDQGIRHNATVCRIYKSGNAWKETQSFGRDDLPLVVKALDLCHTWIFDQAVNESSDSRDSRN